MQLVFFFWFHAIYTKTGYIDFNSSKKIKQKKIKMSFMLIKCKKKLGDLKEGINQMGKYSIVVGEDGTFAIKISKEILEVSFFFDYKKKEW